MPLSPEAKKTIASNIQKQQPYTFFEPSSNFLILHPYLTESLSSSPEALFLKAILPSKYLSARLQPKLLQIPLRTDLINLCSEGCKLQMKILISTFNIFNIINRRNSFCGQSGNYKCGSCPAH